MIYCYGNPKYYPASTTDDAASFHMCTRRNRVAGIYMYVLEKRGIFGSKNQVVIMFYTIQGITLL